MPGPYRTLALVDAEPLPNTCVPSDGARTCPHCAAHRRALAATLKEALAASAIVLLLVCSVSLAAITRTLASGRAHERDARLSHTSHTHADTRSRARALADLGPETHDADALWKRAERLSHEGAPVTLARATFAQGFADAMVGSAVHVRHEKHAGRRGLALVDLDARSPLTIAGLRRGDLITAINGWTLARPEDAARAYAQVATQRTLVVELVRSGRPVVLRIEAAP